MYAVRVVTGLPRIRDVEHTLFIDRKYSSEAVTCALEYDEFDFLKEN